LPRNHFKEQDWVYLSPKALSKLMVARCGLTIMLMVEALLSFLVCLELIDAVKHSITEARLGREKDGCL
jgi:hypothetical protein